MGAVEDILQVLPDGTNVYIDVDYFTHEVIHVRYDGIRFPIVGLDSEYSALSNALDDMDALQTEMFAA